MVGPLKAVVPMILLLLLFWITDHSCCIRDIISMHIISMQDRVLYSTVLRTLMRAL